MAENDPIFKLFGFELKKQKKKTEESGKSIVPPTDEDGAGYVTSTAGFHYGHYLDMSGHKDAKDNVLLIKKYRNIATHPEVDQAIEEIVNETIVTGDNVAPVELNLDTIGYSDSIKKKIVKEFENIQTMLNFNQNGHDMFRSWYVDGRLYHHLVVDTNKPKEGIKEIRYIDSTKIRKVKDVKYKTNEEGVKVVDKVDEFFIFDNSAGKRKNTMVSTGQNSGVKLTSDSVSYVSSGLLDESRSRVVSHLHKAIKPVNQLRMMEDSLVIYRLARAPERRIFYVDVGTLQTAAAEEYIQKQAAKHRNKLVYDSQTGQVRDDRKHMTMLDDFWLPRKEGGRGTEVSTLPGGQNLGEIEDVIYFQKQVFRALNVPSDRLEQQSTYTLGRSTEIQRDEVKFQKFVDRLRTKFSKLFVDILGKQLILKGVITEFEWKDIKSKIFVDYQKDNHFSELKDIEMMRERMNIVDQGSQYLGQLFSKEYMMKQVLRLSDDEMKDMVKQMNAEGEQQPSEDEGNQNEDWSTHQSNLEYINDDDNNPEEMTKMFEAVTDYLTNGK